MIKGFFMAMIAIFVGWVLPIVLRHLDLSTARDRGPIALLIIGVAGVSTFIISGDQVVTNVLTGIAVLALLVRLLCEFGLKHRECSRAVEALNVLPTVEERRVYYAGLSQDIQAMVDKRTPRPDLWKVSVQPILLSDCANPGLGSGGPFLESVHIHCGVRRQV